MRISSRFDDTFHVDPIDKLYEEFAMAGAKEVKVIRGIRDIPHFRDQLPGVAWVAAIMALVLGALWLFGAAV